MSIEYIYCDGCGCLLPHECVCGERERMIGAVIKLRTALRQLATTVLSNRPTSGSRWPCNECGRASKEAPLVGLEVKTDVGLRYYGGCRTCNSEHVGEEARAAIALLDGGVGGEG